MDADVEPACGKCKHVHTMSHQCLALLRDSDGRSYMDVWCGCTACNSERLQGGEHG